MTLMEVTTQKGNNGLAIFHPKDMEFLDVGESQLVKITDEDSSNFAILKAYISENAYQDTLLVDPNILNNIGIQNGVIVDVEPFKGTVRRAKKAKIEFSTIDTDPRDFFKKKNLMRLRNFLKDYHFLQTTEIFWPEQSATLRISIKEPEIRKNQIFKINSNCEINLMEEVQTMPFNAILLIDHSRSMTRYDVSIKGVKHILSDLKNRLLKETYLSRRSALSNLFTRLEESLGRASEKKLIMEGGSVKEVEKSRGASRLDSVLLATLLFFQLKISRGYGEKCVFVIYADDAKSIPLDRGNQKEIIEATEFNPEVCNRLISKIKDHTFMRWGNTNISSAFKHSKEIALDFKKRFENNNPIMILLLTDGRPHPPEIDNPQKLLDTIFDLKEELEEEEIPFIVYAIGIGDETKERGAETLLTRVAKAGNGEFHYVSDVQKLIEWYQKLATNFSYNISKENISYNY